MCRALWRRIYFGMIDKTDDLEIRIGRLALASGDILVVKCSTLPDHEMLSRFVPSGVRVLYIPPEVELSVLTKAEIDERVVG